MFTAWNPGHRRAPWAALLTAFLAASSVVPLARGADEVKIDSETFGGLRARSIGPARDWHLPGAPYLLAALLLLMGMLVAGRVTRPR